jgi:hypothetical protein
MNRVKDKDLLLVGSMPFDTAEQTFRWACDGGLAPALPCLPDGEVGERSYWIIMLGYRLYHGHPQIETLRRPNPVDGVENWKPSGRQDNWSFKVREGVSAVRFGDPGWRLGYARDAINSYFVFRVLREKGIIPNGIRFQVCLPLTYSAFASLFPHRVDWPLIVPGLEESMQAEIATILSHIPANDLTIQWDCAVEVALAERAFAWTTETPLLDLVAQTVSALSPRLPREVMLGYHLCFGTLGGWPMHRPKDLSSCVALAQVVLAHSGRQVDYIHIPVLDHAPESFFAPLKELGSPDTKIYLGVIHHMDDRADYERRISAAARYLADFGIAAPCGFGRQPQSVAGLLNDHLGALALLQDHPARQGMED